MANAHNESAHQSNFNSIRPARAQVFGSSRREMKKEKP
jgi:hypothetical protein